MSSEGMLPSGQAMRKLLARWTLPNFSRIPVGSCKSQSFSYANERWYMRFIHEVRDSEGLKLSPAPNEDVSNPSRSYRVILAKESSSTTCGRIKCFVGCKRPGNVSGRFEEGSGKIFTADDDDQCEYLMSNYLIESFRVCPPRDDKEDVVIITCFMEKLPDTDIEQQMSMMNINVDNDDEMVL